MTSWTKNLIFILLALFLSVLDLSFFSAFSLFGATVLTTFMMIVNLALLAKKQSKEEFLIFQVSGFFVYTLLSSVSIWILLVLFILLPSLILYIRLNYFRTLSLPTGLILLIISNLLFEVFLFLQAKQLNSQSVKTIIAFVIMNSLVGFVILFIASQFRYRKQEIKLR